MTFTKKKDIQFRKCSVDGCENKHKSNGYCSKHVQALRKHGIAYYSTTKVADQKKRRALEKKRKKGTMFNIG